MERQQIKVPINGIDAPEKRQAFGERSKQNLSAMGIGEIPGWNATRPIGTGGRSASMGPAVDCPTCGKTLDVGHAQVVAGMAWWYREYAKEQTAEDQGRYESAENEARLRRWGLGRSAASAAVGLATA